jgi:hypothetical protein
MKEWRMEGVIALAMNAPIMACAAMYGARGTLIDTPLTPMMTPAAIGPRKNAAGSPARCRSAAQAPDKAARNAHWAASGMLANLLADEFKTAVPAALFRGLLSKT